MHVASIEQAQDSDSTHYHQVPHAPGLKATGLHCSQFPSKRKSVSFTGLKSGLLKPSLFPQALEMHARSGLPCACESSVPSYHPSPIQMPSTRPVPYPCHPPLLSPCSPDLLVIRPLEHAPSTWITQTLSAQPPSVDLIDYEVYHTQEHPRPTGFWGLRGRGYGINYRCLHFPSPR